MVVVLAGREDLLEFQFVSAAPEEMLLLPMLPDRQNLPVAALMGLLVPTTIAVHVGLVVHHEAVLVQLREVVVQRVY